MKATKSKAKKGKSNVQVRDLKPKKDAKGGAETVHLYLKKGASK